MGTGTPDAGVLGQPNTVVLFGDDGLNAAVRSGGRFTLGYWLDPYRSTGVEASYLFVGQTTDRFEAASQQIPILARPFYDIQLGQQSAMLIAHPDVMEGSISAGLSTDFQVFEVLLRQRFVNDSLLKVDALAGYRYNRLGEKLSVHQFSRWTVPSIIPVGTTQELFDRFDTNSEFHGAELGMCSNFHVERWSLEFLVKLALGNSRSLVKINGSTTTTVPGVDPVTTAGGLLAQPTNMGRYTTNEFAVIPELGITLGYDIADRLRATFGYTFIYWSRVARPGDQIDFDVNPSQFPPGPLVGPPRPAFNLRSTDFWAQGLNFGLEYSF